MSYSTAIQELKAAIETQGLIESPDSLVANILEADIGNFEGSYQVRLSDASTPLSEFHMEIRDFRCRINLEVGVCIENEERTEAEAKLQGFLQLIVKEVLAKCDNLTEIKSIRSLATPTGISISTQPTRLGFSWDLEIIYSA